MHLRESLLDIAAEQFHEAATVPELWPKALQTTASACGAFGVNLFAVGPGLAEAVCSPDIKPLADDLLSSGWLSTNPYMRRGMELTAAGWKGLITSEAMLTPEETASDPYVNEYRLPRRLGPEAGMVLVAGPDVAVPITLDRRSSDAPYAPREISVLNRFMALVKPAARLAVQVGLASAKRLADGLGGLGQDIALLGASGRVIYAPPGLGRHLDDALTLRGGFLRSWHHPSDIKLMAAVSQAASQATAAQRVVAAVPLPRRQRRRPLVAQVVPITGAGQDLFMLARAALILTDPEANRPLDVAADALRMMGLTPAEARLAVRIGAGEELRDIAEAEGIAVETARARLKSVFAKTGVRRQAELALLVISLSR